MAKRKIIFKTMFRSSTQAKIRGIRVLPDAGHTPPPPLPPPFLSADPGEQAGKPYYMDHNEHLVIQVIDKEDNAEVLTDKHYIQLSSAKPFSYNVTRASTEWRVDFTSLANVAGVTENLDDPVTNITVGDDGSGGGRKKKKKKPPVKVKIGKVEPPKKKQGEK